VVLVGIAIPHAALAQEGGAGVGVGAGAGAGVAAPAAGGAEALPDGPIELIIGSGPIGWFICCLSVVVVGLAIEGFVTIKRDKLLPEDVLSDIETCLDEGQLQEALDICESEECLTTRILGAGLGKALDGTSYDRIAEAMGDEAEVQATFLHQKLGYINLIATMSPMLGLLGTVQGMVGAFGEIARSPTAGPQQLAGGIYVALMTTLLGLIVAIPASAIFAFLRNRVVRILMDVGMVQGEILERFRGGMEVEPGLPPKE